MGFWFVHVENWVFHREQIVFLSETDSRRMLWMCNYPNNLFSKSIAMQLSKQRMQIIGEGTSQQAVNRNQAVKWLSVCTIGNSSWDNLWRLNLGLGVKLAFIYFYSIKLDPTRSHSLIWICVFLSWAQIPRTGSCDHIRRVADLMGQCGQIQGRSDVRVNLLGKLRNRK